MKIRYIETTETQIFDNTRPENAINYRYGEKSEVIKEPITITLHVEIDKAKYEKLKLKFKTKLSDRIFSYFGF